ncbi:glycosyltransferase [Arcicella sp. LKC2W]|uniref:glycosyltransferase n=1 Tax=Arcicella sp. LKC2W TaxID=2984198 RepID=UPI002B21CEC3|nr:glycosyltransferase [Arcicella sp. LKC2W]MEA5459742.1 glycosyltransferase [Arcicella sp. LKC2W]
MHSDFTNSLILTALIPLLFSIFIISVAFQLYFILFVFAKVIQQDTPIIPIGKSHGVSVIVCAWNELVNLKELLPLLNAQEYPTFEVIIVDDRSWDGTFDYLLGECSEYQKVRFLRIDQTPEHLSSKKYALTLGIKSAKYETILLTDADCRPQSINWIAGMAECLSTDKEIVLGFSPYFSEKGFLNNLIRYETFITAIQYFSFAITGVPYMGVGRNLMYKKSLFLQNKGFAKHTNILGGDDDLFMNDVANDKNTAVCLNPNTFMYSFPKTTWETWYRQKRRHLSVGKYYQFKNKALLGALASTQILSWISFIILAPLFRHNPVVFWVLGVFLLRLISQWIIFFKANKRFDNTLETFTFPFWDGIFALYFLIMGINNFIPRRQKMRWR